MLRWAKLINLPIALAATAVVGYVSIDAHTTATRQEEVLVGLAQQVTELQAAVSKVAQDAKALAAVKEQPAPIPIQAEAHESPGSAEELALLREELHTLRAGQTELQQDLNGLAWQLAQDTLSGLASKDPDYPSVEVAPENVMVELDQDFHFQTEDPTWSYQAVQDIETSIAAESLPGADLLGVDCRATLCQVEMVFQDTAARDQSLGMLPLLLPWSGEGHIHIDEAGDPNRIVLYVAREGINLRGEPE